MKSDPTIEEDKLIRYINGESTQQESLHVEQWMAASDENLKLARQLYYIAFAADTRQVMSEVDTQKALRRVRHNIRNNAWRRSLNRMQRVAAILFLPMLVASACFIVTLMRTSDDIVEVRTNPGMVTSITLPDSTVVWLNSESSIKYPRKFSRKSRNVSISGEAYFAVRRDADRKFIVTTPKDIKIEVLGTEFNIEAYDCDKEVAATLISGKVEFQYSKGGQSSRIVMKPSQKVVYNSLSQTATIGSVNCLIDTAWKDGKIIFKDTSLEDALHILGKRFNVEFSVRNPKLLRHHFTGVFVHQRLERILEHFAVSSNVKYRYICVDNADEKSCVELY